MRIAAVIPARLASSRFPRKPLLNLFGLPMIEHVRRRVTLCRTFSEIVVATCDEEIADVVRAAGGRVAWTSSEHLAATDRVAEAAQGLECTHVVNVQGDEVLVLPQDLETLTQAIQKNPEIPYWNAVARVESEQELEAASVVKCVVSCSGRILYCSRQFSARAGFNGNSFEPIRKVLGVLAYRKETLETYPALARTPLEVAESVDQSRIVEHDLHLQSVTFQHGYLGINQPGEVSAVLQILEKDPLQRSILRQIQS